MLPVPSRLLFPVLLILASMAVIQAATPTSDADEATAQPGVPVHARGVFVEPGAATAVVASQPVLRPLEVVDRNGFGQPLTALHMHVPEGWQVDAGVDWDPQTMCAWNAAQMRVSATAPGGLHGISLMPGLGWQVASRPMDKLDPCPPAPMQSVREYLEFVATHARPGMRVLAYRDRADLSAPTAQFPEYGGELLIGYSLDGHEQRETLVVTLMQIPMQSGGMVVVANPTLAVRAPDGQLDFAFVEKLRASLRPDPVWRQRYEQWSLARMQDAQRLAQTALHEWHNRRMNQIALEGMAARHRIRMETIAEVGRINAGIHAQRSASSDRIQAATVDAIREVSPWRDPATGRQHELSMHYRHAWQLSDGRRFLTNDPDFDPWRDLGIAGQRMEPVR